MTARTHLRVRRNDGQEFANMDAAFRALAGTVSEITNAERRSIRARLRAGAAAVADAHGFTWALVEPTMAVSAITWDSLTFGVELEVVATDRVNRPVGNNFHRPELLSVLRTDIEPFIAQGWKAVRDGSVSNGGEVVSPVLKGIEGLRQLEQVCSRLKERGWTANRACGMHVHVGVRQFTVAQISDLCRLFKANEQQFDSIVAPSRRANNCNYAQSHSRFSVPAVSRTIAGLARSFNGGWDSQRHYTPHRYRKLNLQSYAIHGTVEFRQHQGTVEADRACGWVRLVLGFAASGLGGNTQALEFGAFAQLAGDREQFIKSRRERFAARVAA